MSHHANSTVHCNFSCPQLRVSSPVQVRIQHFVSVCSEDFSSPLRIPVGFINLFPFLSCSSFLSSTSFLFLHQKAKRQHHHNYSPTFPLLLCQPRHAAGTWSCCRKEVHSSQCHMNLTLSEETDSTRPNRSFRLACSALPFHVLYKHRFHLLHPQF